MQTLKTTALEWHHFSRPSSADLKWLKTHFHLHQLVVDELGRPTVRPRSDRYDSYLYIILHFPIFNEEERKTYSREVDFILTRKALVTVAYDQIKPLEDFFKQCLSEESALEAYASGTPAHLFYFALKGLYGFAMRELDHIQENINQLEERVFSEKHEEEALIEDLSFVRRDIIDFRRSLKPQQLALESLVAQGVSIYGVSLKPFFEELIGEYQKVWNLIENSKEAVDALYDNNVAVLNIKQNETMRILSIMAFTTFPLVLFAQLFSMSTVATPIIGARYDFWIIISLMLIAVIGMFVFFKRKKWL